jgi:hypothetical protein
MGRESGGKSSLRRARKEDGATDEITEGAPIAWRRFRAHVGQGCAEAAVRGRQNGRNVVDHEVSSGEVRVRARSWAELSRATGTSVP